MAGGNWELLVWSPAALWPLVAKSVERAHILLTSAVAGPAVAALALRGLGARAVVIVVVLAVTLALVLAAAGVD